MGGKAEGGERVNRREAEEVYKILWEILSGIPIKLWMTGSYRRKLPDMGDVDFVIPYPNEMIRDDILVRLRGHWGDQKNGKVRTSGLVELDSGKKVQVDILMTPKERLGAALMHLTGSPKFNIYCRARAKKMGYMLNEKGLFNRETKGLVACGDERSIFEVLEMEYLPPEKREMVRWN